MRSSEMVEWNSVVKLSSRPASLEHSPLGANPTKGDNVSFGRTRGMRYLQGVLCKLARYFGFTRVGLQHIPRSGASICIPSESVRISR